jgi:hypothetical protein
MAELVGALLIDRAWVPFLEGGVSIVLATAGDDLTPDLVQVVGCRVLIDGRIVLSLSRAQGENVVESLLAGRPLAVTFSSPTTFRTLQITAARADVGPPTRADLDAHARYVEAFRAELAKVGFGGSYADAIVGTDVDSLVVVTFTPNAAFEQTPGANAGRPLGEPR